MTLEKRFQHFIERATKLHNYKFDYSLVNYICAKTKIRIICPEHGEFLQTPDKHLAVKSKGCQKCWHKIQIHNAKIRDRSKDKRRTLTKEEFLQRCSLKYKDKFIYDLSNYKGLTKIKIKITCPIHGDFFTFPQAHISKQNTTGCSKCGKINCKEYKTQSYQESIQKCAEKHNFEYDYPEYNELNYINKKSVIDIICKKHGLFKKKAQKHLAGQGCFRCGIDSLTENNILVGGYSEDLFKNKPELKDCPACLYYFSINKGKYFKIGISKGLTNQRIRGITSKAKKFNEPITIELVKIKKDTLYNCFLSEQQILNKYKNIRILRRWSTELFSKDILEEIKHYFE